jgi:hypothetical protein
MIGKKIDKMNEMEENKRKGRVKKRDSMEQM